ncbi:MAG: efflux RND transporter periplasmic adaptor subunit [Gammaproteobacteria bacterium]|nr:efflux RND transporter periplasmic adaptor subunit [Gammaproteobacteria bacterium]
MKPVYVFVLCSYLITSGCDQQEDGENTPQIIRGLKTMVIEKQERATIRRYPSVLQPAELTTLSFEIGGKLGVLDLKVGQVVHKGERLAQLDAQSAQIQVETAEAKVTQAKSKSENARTSYTRQSNLLKKGATTKANVDDAKTALETSNAQLTQAKKQLEADLEKLNNLELVSPIDGIVNSVEAKSYSNVRSGDGIATIYQSDGFEVSFSVGYDVLQKLTIGKTVTVRLADNPDVLLGGIVNEIGSRADTVSSFPIVIRLIDSRSFLKAGMAVEVSIELPVQTGVGFLLPLSVLPFKGTIDPNAGPDHPTETTVFVYNENTGTVVEREVTVAGIRENQMIIIAGIKEGERVASAGVSFLQDGQKVTLLDDAQ